MSYFKYFILFLFLTGCSGGQFIKPIKVDRSQCKDKLGEHKEKCFQQVEALKKSLKKYENK
jgi:hypothetical protein